MILGDGDTIGGRYVVQSYVDEGGMQEVYRAQDTVLNRVIALKTPKSKDAGLRFRRSAICSARVNHPNAARTLDWLQEDAREFLIEEFIEGADLSKVLKSMPSMDPAAVAQLLHHLARGLAALHEQDIVHRDIKPSNVMVVGGLNPREFKITDFGVARMAGEEIDAAIRGGMATITGSKTLIGHLPYMAPEVLRNRKIVSSAADIWAVGALAYQALAGDAPFGTELAEAVMAIVSGDPPALPRHVEHHPQFGHLGRELHGVILRCLTKDPESRPTARELLQLCGQLCYPPLVRQLGTVESYPARTFGFIRDSSSGESVFFHLDSVYGGRRPREGSSVWFTAHDGAPRPRAHPVVPVMSNE